MKKRVTRLTALMTVAAMAATASAGCGAKQESAATAAAAPAATQAAATQAAATAAATKPAETEIPKEFTYPMETGHSLQYWGTLNSVVSPHFANLGETEYAKALKEATGIDVEYLHPASGQDKEQFNLMIADGELPDVIEWQWTSQYSGGPTKALQDGVIIPLNDIIDEYCPNLKAYLEANPAVEKSIKTDDGIIYMFPCVNAPEVGVTFGAYFREDLLKDLNLEVPDTIDEWYTTLQAFKEAGVEYPLSGSVNYLLKHSSIGHAYGVGGLDFVVHDNKVEYAPYRAEFKDYLMTMNKWYSEGLIDVDLATIKNDQVTAKMATGKVGAAMGYLASAMQKQLEAGMAESGDPDFSLVAAPIPQVTEGVPAQCAKANSLVAANGAAITSQCEDVEAAARWLDYIYSEEGTMLYNYGVEGVSYEMVNGEPLYTDEIFKNPDGMAQADALGKYQRASYNGAPGIQSPERYLQTLTHENIKNALGVWTVEGAVDHIMPAVTLTVEESSECATIKSELDTYVNEMMLKFVLGTESFDNWDTYVKTLEQYGVVRAIEIQQAAYDRFMAR